MNFKELQDEVKFILNWNEGQTNQDFSNTRIKKAINSAYQRETIKAEEEGSQRFFKATLDLTWASGTGTFVIPSGLNQDAIIAIHDVTTAEIGTPLIFSDDGVTGDIFWKDHQTLGWGTNGPNSDKKLRFIYYANAEEMVADGDVPMLIPYHFHELIAWAAAIRLNKVSGQNVPPEWKEERDELRIDFWKWLSRGRGTEDVPTIKNIKTNIDGGLIY